MILNFPLRLSKSKDEPIYYLASFMVGNEELRTLKFRLVRVEIQGLCWLNLTERFIFNKTE